LPAPGPAPAPLAGSGGGGTPSCSSDLASGEFPKASVARTELWPPNHQLQDVGLRVNEGDACAGLATTHVAVYSDEPDDASGDGSTIHDAQLVAPDLFLRSERQGGGNGRVYLILATTSYQGTTGRDCATVVVPQSQSKKDRDSALAQAASADATCEAGGVPTGFQLLTQGTLGSPNQPPAVSAGPDQGIELGGTAQLDGTASDDGQPAGSTLAVSWSVVSGPGAVTFTQPAQVDTDASFASAGVYQLRLTATDGQLTSFDDVQVVVQATNAAPSVHAGADVSLVLPTTIASLAGSVTDDGRLLTTPVLTWSQLSGPPGATFSQPSSASTQVSLPGLGEYDLRLTAFDGQLTASDVVRVTVSPEPPPTVDVADATVSEGHEGLAGASVEVRLSKPWTAPVSVDYVTQDTSAVNPCDYRRRFGSLAFLPGETHQAVLVPIVGDHAQEGDESLEVLLGNPVGATLGRDRALVGVTDDDVPNQPPAPHSLRSPASGSGSVSAPPLLSWTTSDPDGDVLTHDVYLGSAFSTTGQQWLAACPSGTGPGVRFGAATGYDEANDRLVVYGGEAESGAADTDVYVLAHASAAGGAPTWERYTVSGGPGPLAYAAYGYDAATNRLIVFGGCRGTCATPTSETWVLTHANGLGGTPGWTQAATSGPAPRFGAAAGFDLADNWLVVHGGMAGELGPVLADTWVLDSANGVGVPTWRAVAPHGVLPAARAFASLSHDASSGRFVLFGGRDEAGVALGDVHVLADAAGSSPEWHALVPVLAGPAGRFGHAAAFDPATRRLLVYGGTTGGIEDNLNYVFADAWMLTEADGVAADPEWVRVDGGPAPAGRFAASTAWSAGANRLLVFGGANNKLAAAPSDLWLLGDAFGQLPLVAAALASPSYEATEAADGKVYQWRVVSRDSRGAWRGAPAWSLSTNHAPTVEVGGDLSVALPPGVASLSASVSDDGLPAGGSLSYAWSVVNGPGPVAFADAASPATTATFTLPGVYTLRLTVSDSQGATSDSLVVTVSPFVPPPNQAPLVSAGPDRSLRQPETSLLLAGTAADDGRPSGTLSHAWSVVSGPDPVSFADPLAVSTTATFASPGTYVLRLAASDGELTASDEATVFYASDTTLPDLVVKTVDLGALMIDTRTLAVSGSASVELANAGNGTAAGPIALTLFEDRNANGQYDAGTDAVLGEVSLPGLDGQAAEIVPVAVGGAVTFAGNLVYAFVDSALVVPELDEANNYASSAPTCGLPRSPSAWDVGVEWLWTAPSQDPGSNRVTVPPVVIDLDGDDAPDVVFVSAYLGAVAYATQSRLRAVSGRDGRELWSVTDPALGLNGNIAPAAADIDGDGRPEILVGSDGTPTLLAFEHDGTLKWRSDPIPFAIGWAAPSIADLDADGVPEIVVGRTVLTNQGRIRWTGSGTNRGGDQGAHSIVVDLDRDGRPEVVAGNTAYVGQGATQGQVLWRNTSPIGTATVQDGYAAPGNFDADANAEIVLVSRGWLLLLEHDGTVKWGPVHTDTSITGLWAGPPTVADVDGDGDLEIAVAGQRYFVVFEGDGSVKWRAPIEDSTTSTGSVAFDFDGDGAAELAYGDHNDVRIYRGGDGQILFRDRTASATGNESPVVADVDGDGEAEMIAVTDNWFTGSIPGVRVYGEANGLWASARPLANQYAYSTTHVNDDLSVPAYENRDLMRGHRWMHHAAASSGEPGCAFPRPDLTASALRIAEAAGDWELTVRVGNGGARVVGPDVPVSFYDGDPRLGALKLGTVSTSAVLAPGQFVDLLLRLPRPTTTRGAVFVSADDVGGLEGRITESDEDNNVLDGGQALVAAGGLPDLAVVDVDVSALVTDGKTLALTGTASARVRNQSTVPVSTPFEVAFFEDRDGDGVLGGADVVLARATLPGLGPLETTTAEAAASGSLLFAGSPVRAFVDSATAVVESDESNNVARAGIACQAAPPGPPFTLRQKWAWTAGTVLSNPAAGDLDGDGVAEVVFVTPRTGQPTLDGQLKALRGNDGSTLFTVTDLAHELSPSASPAIGDIDGDGRPEIVALAESNVHLVAFEHDGAFKWRSLALELNASNGAPFLADLDGDGKSEVVIGRQVLNGSTGALLFTGTAPMLGRSPATGPRSVAVDLDLDGRPEVIAGASAYRADGTLLWQNAAVGDGVVAVGNLDSDAYPEIAVGSSGARLWLLEHDGTVRAGPITVPGSSNFGTVTLADFDGDAQNEIAISRWPSLSVFEGYGQARWSQTTASPTLVAAAASAFDFDGDGASELVIADTTGLHVLSGRDGSVLAELPTGSCSTAHAYPLVADVDGDGKADIVMGSHPCSGGVPAGVRVFGEDRDGWVGARPVWNQFEYSPAGEGTWRANAAPAASSPFAAADLTASFVRRSESGSDLLLTARIGNGGVGTVPPGVPVSAYNGDPRLGYAHLTTTLTTRFLAAGEYEDVVLRISSQVAAHSTVHVAADDAGDQRGQVRECDETNNLHDTGLFLNQAPTVDAGPDRTASLPNATLAFAATIDDDGLPLGGPALSVSWFYAGPLLPHEVGQPFSDPTSASTTFTLPVAGTHVLGIQVSDSRQVGTDFVQVTIHPANTAPVVSAGADQSVTRPATSTTLQGSVQDDGLPSGSQPVSAWTLVSGPGSVSFGSPSSPVTPVQLSADGTYVFRLSASDGSLSASDEVTVVLEPANSAPVVSAGPDQRVLGLTTALEGSVTDDGKPEGGTLGSIWSVVSGPGGVAFTNAASAATSVQFAAPGTYVLRLTASDGALSASDDVEIVANPGNEPPRVSAGLDGAVTSAVLLLAGQVADDGLPAGGTLSSQWTLVSGPGAAIFTNAASPTTAVRFEADGAFTLRLTASDGELQASDDVTFTVARVNQAPSVEAGAGQAIVLPVGSVLLAGTASDDGLPAPASLTYHWSLASGPGAVRFGDSRAASTSASFDAPGLYVLRLTASDGTLAGSDTVQVAVNPGTASGPAPTVEIASPQGGGRITEPTNVVGTVTSGDLFGWTLEHRLRGEGEWTVFARGAAEATNAVLGQLDPTMLPNGLHEVRLSATDNGGRTGRATTVVVVRDNLKVGHFTVSFVDLEVPVAGQPIRVTRTYDSRDKRIGDFGHGWRLDVSNVRVQTAATLGLAWYGTASPGAFPTYCLQPTAPPVVTLTLPDGRVMEFEVQLARPGSATSSLPPNCQSFAPIDTATVSFAPVGPTLGKLELVGSNVVEVVGSWPGPVQLFNTGYSLLDPALYRYTSPDGQVFVVDKTAGLKSLTDRAGNVLTMTPLGIYSQHPQVAGSSLGIVFQRDAQGRITRITDPQGKSLVYAYDTNGDLESVTDRETHTTSFGYLDEPAHHLETIEDPLGRTPIKNEYDPSGRLVAHVDAFNNRIEYTHDLVGRQEIVKDRTGAQRVLEYDERGNVLRETDPQGKVVVRTFDARNNRLSETEPYDPSNPPDPIPTTSYSYDASDNLLTTTDALGHTTTYTYNVTRQVLTTKDARNHTTTNTYDASGNLLTTKDALNNVTAYSYDARGNVLTQTVTVGATTQVTGYEYDSYGRLKKETDATGHATSHTYDSAGNRLTQATTRTVYTCTAAAPPVCSPSGTEMLTTVYSYDANGRLETTTDPDNSVTRTAYDALGRQVDSFDKLNRKTSYEYDEMGRLVKTTHPDDTTDEHGYDPEGRRTSSKDRGGRTTIYEYDSLGRLKKTTYPDTTFTENTYDPSGKLVATKDARGKTTSYEYDLASRRTAVVDPLNHRTVFGYDGNGNQETVTDPKGNVTTFEYDKLNRRTKTVFPSADGVLPRTETITGYDELGRRTSETDQAGKTTSFEYDTLGRLTAVIDALDQRTSYGYDELGNRLSQTDANGHTTWFLYDKLGRQTARILPDGKRELMAYDPAGNLETRTDFMGRQTSYSYDDNNRLLSRTYPNSAENVSFTYTPTGRRLTATDARGTTSYGYDVRDRLLSLMQPGFGSGGTGTASLGYTYDGNGNRLTLTATVNGQSHTTGYTYDDAGRLDLVTDPAGRVYDHGYDRNGNRESLAHPNGVATGYTYDNLNRLTNLATTHPALARHIQSYRFTLGPAGNRTQIVEHQGLPQQRTLDYSYDSLYRLTGETVTESLGLVYSKSFGYDPVGNRQSQTTTIGPAGSPGPNLQPGPVSYGYDTRDRLLSEQLDAAPATGYGWDSNGNLTTKDAEATYTWDHENRLVRIDKTDGTVVEHSYDVDGNRVRTATTPPAGSTTTTDFLVDTSASLSHVVAEVDVAAAPPSLQALYIRGDDLLSVMRPLVAAPASASDWQTRYYHADGLGSIRRLTDETGNITDGYTYSAFGELLAHTGTDSQPYAFTGEPLDPNSGWQYHRARWLVATAARFASLDPFGGFQTEPLSLHKYTYASADPIRRVDPSGRFGLVQGLALVGAIVTIAAISFVAWRFLPKRAAINWGQAQYRLGTRPLESAERDSVKRTALDTARLAFGGMNIEISNAISAGHIVELVPGAGGKCGLRIAAGCTSSGRYSKVWSETLSDPAPWVGRFYNKSEPEMVEGLGRGLGYLIAHELAHQVLWGTDTARYMDQVRDPLKIDFHASLGGDLFWAYDWMYGGQLHWSDSVKQGLISKIGTR
jgi:RHS repeat-associated protein